MDWEQIRYLIDYSDREFNTNGIVSTVEFRRNITVSVLYFSTVLCSSGRDTVVCRTVDSGGTLNYFRIFCLLAVPKLLKTAMIFINLIKYIK